MFHLSTVLHPNHSEPLWRKSVHTVATCRNVGRRMQMLTQVLTQVLAGADSILKVAPNRKALKRCVSGSHPC